MKSKLLIFTAFTVCLTFGCRQAEPTGHVHDESGQEHTHEGEDAAHTHEGEDAAHAHEGEDQAHTHGPDDQGHTHFEGEDEVEVVTLKKQEFNDVLKTTGVILSSREDLQVYHASANGFIHFTNKSMVPGSKVLKGEVLFEVRGGILSDANSDLKFKEIKLEYEKEKANFERAANLIDDQIISQEEYLETKSDFEKAKNRYQLYLASRDNGGQKILSASGGYIKDLYVSEGDYVHAGDEIATAISQNKLILRADVPQNNFNKLTTYTAATFTTSYGYRVYRSNALDGKLLAYSRSTDESSFFTPIAFEIDHHPDLIPGSFVEINLIGDPIEGAIVLPKSALMEDQGKIYVFVQLDTGEYEKHYIELGATDGEYVQVLAGLEEHMKVVSEGAYYVKLSTMATDLPASHSH